VTDPRLSASLAECAFHAQVIEQSLAATSCWPPFDPDRVEEISEGDRRLLDQLAYRFGKLQDTLGERVLPALLDLVEEPLPESATFAEKLQRLERLRAIDSAAEWKFLRELRNPIAHEYPDAPDLRAAALNRFRAGIPVLLNCWRGVLQFIERAAPDCLPKA
jgi:hypothetical protein